MSFSFNKLVSGTIGYRLKEWSTGAPISKTGKLLKESQYWPSARLNAYRSGKLRALVTHAYQHVPYYRQLFDEIGLVPEAVRRMEDLQKIPVLDKETARKENLRLASEIHSGSDYVVSKTGGTTGPPLVVHKDRNAYAMDWAILYRWYNWLGVKAGDPVVNFWGASTVLSGSRFRNLRKGLTDMLQNQTTYNSFGLNDQRGIHILHQLKRNKPRLIKGYLSSLLQLARIMEKQQLDLGYIPAGILPTSETLYPNLREYLEKTFQSRVYNQYGCGEINGIANECPTGKGLHINAEHVIVEIAGDEDQGRIIVTDLDDFSMPFIRYEIGDVGTLSREPCSCGRSLPLLKTVEGRTADSIVLKDGSRAHGVFFTDILYEMDPGSAKYINTFQVYQDRRGEIEFRVVLDGSVYEDFLARLEKELNRFFTRVVIRTVESIPKEKNGKFRYMVGLVKE